MADGPQNSSPTGWYHDGEGRLRWWDGWRWTEHLAVPIVGRQRLLSRPGGGLLLVGIVLVTCAVLSFGIAGLAVMGDPYPVSHVGVSADADGFSVVNAVCPGERMREVGLWRRTASGPYVEVWRISGDAALPERVPLGSVPSGMHTVTALVEPLTSQEPLSLQVVTSELDSPYAMEFVLADVPSKGVLSFGSAYPTTEAFTKATLADTPCGDPYSKKGVERFARIVLLGGAGAGLVGATLLVLARRRRLSTVA